MNHLLASIVRDVFVPTTVIGAVFYGAVCFGIAAVAARLIRVLASRSERHLTDVTALRFVVQLLQMCAFLVAFILYMDLRKGTCDTTRQTLGPCDERACGMPVFSGHISHNRENR
jgi:hypothetical protein